MPAPSLIRQQALKTKTPESPIRVTPEQFLAIVDNIRSQYCLIMDVNDSADLIEFMGKAGVGTAECADLRGEHIDFESHRITLYRNKTDTGFAIPLFPQILSLLERMKEYGRIRNGEFVFRVSARTEGHRKAEGEHYKSSVQ